MSSLFPRTGLAATFKNHTAPTDATLLPLRVGKTGDRNFVSEEIVCQRPVRIGGVRVETETIAGKRVVHCYGHGGSGWTLAPGTSEEAVGLLVNQLSGRWTDQRGADVVIIGSGIVGQMCAYNLHKLRAKQPGLIGAISMIAANSEGITSDHAGGLFEPVLFGRNVIQKKSFLNSYDFYRDVSLGRNADFPGYEAELLPVFSNWASPPAQELMQLGEIPPAIRMGVRINNTLHRWVMTQLFYMNVLPFNRLLFKTLRNFDIPIQTGVTVDAFEDVSAPIVFNCTGLGAQKLCNDKNVVPFTGHLVTFKNQPRGLLDIANTQFVEASQVPGVLNALDQFKKAFPENGMGFDDPKVSEAFTRLRQAHADIRARLRDPVVEADPDWSTFSRVRLFDTSVHRNSVVFDHSKLIAATANETSPERHLAAVSVYSSMINMAMKRYMFGIVEDYPTAEQCEDCPTSYSADSYAFPLLQARLQESADGGYDYIEQSRPQDGVSVFVAGGTYIEGSSLTPSQDAAEFTKILERLRFLGF